MSSAREVRKRRKAFEAAELALNRFCGEHYLEYCKLHQQMNEAFRSWAEIGTARMLAASFAERGKAYTDNNQVEQQAPDLKS